MYVHSFQNLNNWDRGFQILVFDDPPLFQDQDYNNFLIRTFFFHNMVHEFQFEKSLECKSKAQICRYVDIT